MPRAAKRKRPPEERASSVSLEVISLVRTTGGRYTKKRIVEKTDFDPRASPITFPDDDVLPAPAPQADPSTFTDNASEEPSPSTTSRSVSVSFLCVCLSSPTYPLQTKVQEWIPYRAEFLHELLRLEAPASQNPTCPRCETSAEYRCLSCFSAEPMCKGCLLSRHADTPLHRIQVRFWHFTTSYQY